MRKKTKIVNILLVISIIIILLASSASHFIFNKRFYYKEYEKHGVYDDLGENITKAATFVIFDYFHNREDIEWVKPFTEEERSHLKDVKQVIGMGYAAYALAVLVCLGSILYIARKNYTPMHKYRKTKTLLDYKSIMRQVFYCLQLSSMITIAILLVIAVVFALGGFDFLFTVFHKVFFPQGNWQFPLDYFLVRLFPQGFFLDIGLAIYLRALIESLIALVLSLGASSALAKN